MISYIIKEEKRNFRNLLPLCTFLCNFLLFAVFTVVEQQSSDVSFVCLRGNATVTCILARPLPSAVWNQFCIRMSLMCNTLHEVIRHAYLSKFAPFADKNLSSPMWHNMNSKHLMRNHSIIFCINLWLHIKESKKAVALATGYY